jgi:hypothetical protein
MKYHKSSKRQHSSMRLTSIMMLMAFTVLALMPTPLLAAGEISSQWSKDYGGNGAEAFQCVQQTTDGGFIMAGYTYSMGAGGRDVYIVKSDLNGTEKWKTTFGNAGDDSANWIEQTSDGGYIVAGYTRKKYEDKSDIWVIKLDKEGKKSWDSKLGGANSDEAMMVKPTRDGGGYIITGFTESYGAGGRDAYSAYLNNDGILVWEKTFGGTGNDGFNAVIQDKDHAFLMVGYTDSSGAGSRDAFIVKTNVSGQLIWKQTLGGTGADSGAAIIQTENEDYVIVGYKYESSSGGTDILLSRLNKDGKQLWEKTYGISSQNTGVAVHETTDKRLIVLGNTSSYGLSTNGAYLIKTDSAGNKLQEKTLGSAGPDQANWGCPTNYSGYIIAGMKNMGSPGGNNAYLLKLSFLDSNWADEKLPDTNVQSGAIDWPDTSEYKGGVINGKANGWGRIEFPDGTVYEGAWQNNLFNGQGKLTFPDGNVYTGGFRDNMFYGQGKYTWPTGEEYVGQFRYNKRQGDGVFTWSSYVKYTGEFVKDAAEGYGTLSWSNGEQYTGQFSGGEPNGLGTYTFANGDRYVGNMAGLTFSGLGTYYWVSGARYVGEWADDMLTGQGTYYWPNGASQWGYWKEDRYIGLYPDEK